MKIQKRCAIFSALFLSVTLTAHADSNTSTLVANAQSFEAKMKASGAEVLQGNWNLFSIEDCKYAIAKTGMCFGNNPAAPYIVPTLPLWPD